MVYLEHIPVAPLDGCIQSLWYAQMPDADHSRERILPTGRVQIILNLARDFLLDCPEGRQPVRQSSTLIVGARSIYEIVETSDMADLIGIVFKPGGFPPFVRDCAHLFSNRSVDLEGVWGSSVRSLRDCLHELPCPEAKLRVLEQFLLDSFNSRLARHPVVEFALTRFRQTPDIATVREVARSTGLSQRRFSQVFREQVGFSPKVFARILRFQRAVRQLHAGVDLPWAELAIECGFYDQSHFANEFRAFSGIDATTYSAHNGPWTNHVALN